MRWTLKVSMGPTFYRLRSLSFHVNRPSHSWDTTFSEVNLENPGSTSWVGWTSKVTSWAQHSFDSYPFRSMPIGHPIPEIQLYKIWPWQSKVKVMLEDKVESHKVDVTSYRFVAVSFHVNRPFHSWDTIFSQFDLENRRWNDNDVAQLQI